MSNPIIVGTNIHKALLAAEAAGRSIPDIVMGEEMYDAMTEQTLAEFKKSLSSAEIISEFPDRLCIEHKSRFFSTSCPYVGVKISYDETSQVFESNDIVEYCLSGRWVRLGKRDAAGNLIKHRSGFETTRYENVHIELYWRYGPSRQVRRALKRVGG